MEYFILGILSPVILNLIHLIIGVFIVLKYGNTFSLGFTGLSFLTKTGGLLFLTWLGVGYFDLDFKLYVPLLTFVWFTTHLIEAFVIQYFLKKNQNKTV